MNKKTTVSIIIVILAVALVVGVVLNYKQKPEEKDTRPEIPAVTKNQTSPAPVKEIKTGQINTNKAEVVELQKAVDNGHQPWRLDPLWVAKAEALKYGFSENDTFTLKQIKAWTGISEVEVLHDGKMYLITLSKPIPGELKIWVIQNIQEINVGN